MSQISPWYSLRHSDRNVYHDDDRCPVGREIDEKFRMKGHRCRQRCRVCAKLREPAIRADLLAELVL